ncbi:hypothetical protein TYRP_006305 [Tyrophagus putrescentiae]|nr:hypothetical protein TYRP_006305 [Tyrophagus putrescentiae]
MMQNTRRRRRTGTGRRHHIDPLGRTSVALFAYFGTGKVGQSLQSPPSPGESPRPDSRSRVPFPAV